MVYSMTGYGRGEVQLLSRKLIIELKSVNNRFCEVLVHLPRMFSTIEEMVKKTIRQEVSRGRVDVYFNLENVCENSYSVKVDKNLALAYYKAVRDLQLELGLDGNIVLDQILSFPNVVLIEEEQFDSVECWPIIEQALKNAVLSMKSMRETEGKALAEDISNRVARIGNVVDNIENLAPLMVQKYKERLLKLLNDEMPGDLAAYQDRLMAEVLIVTDKSDISEEIVRLRSHLNQMMNFINDCKPVGRKMDFLIQEINREINTIGSKSSSVEISSAVVELKGEVEKIREQVQNIE